MKIPYLSSISKIKRRYHTGEEPVLVECNDRNSYVCKYMRSSSSAYKLSCEFIGAFFAKIWGICVPDAAFVKIKKTDWSHYGSINFSAPSFGSRIIPEAIDVTGVSYARIKRTEKVCRQLLRIGLFDIWICNEDRNYNNSNLLYNLRTQDLIAIDHGCIFNTASFEFNLSPLTSNETILQSDLAYNLFKGISIDLLNGWIDGVMPHFKKSIDSCREVADEMVSQMPKEWNVPHDIVSRKIIQLTDRSWEEKCWNTFLEMIGDCNYV